MTQLGDRIDSALTNTTPPKSGPLPAPIFFGLGDADPLLAASTTLMLVAAGWLYASALDETPPPVRALRKMRSWVIRCCRTRGALR